MSAERLRVFRRRSSRASTSRLYRRIAGNCRTSQNILFDDFDDVDRIVVERVGRCDVFLFEIVVVKRFFVHPAARSHAGQLGLFQVGLATATADGARPQPVPVEWVCHRCLQRSENRLVVPAYVRSSDRRASFSCVEIPAIERLPGRRRRLEPPPAPGVETDFVFEPVRLEGEAGIDPRLYGRDRRSDRSDRPRSA